MIQLIKVTTNLKRDNGLLLISYMNSGQTNLERKEAQPHKCNYAIGRVSSPLDSFMLAESLKLRINPPANEW